MSQISRVRFPPRPTPVDLDALRSHLAQLEAPCKFSHQAAMAEIEGGRSSRSVATIRGMIGSIIQHENLMNAGRRIEQILAGDIDALLTTDQTTPDQLAHLYHVWTTALTAELAHVHIDQADYPNLPDAERHLAQVRRFYGQALWPVGILLLTPPEDLHGGSAATRPAHWPRPSWETVPLSHVIPTRWQEEGVPMSDLVRASQFVRLTEGWEPELPMKLWCELWDSSVVSSTTRAGLTSRTHLPTGAQRELTHWLSAPSCGYLWETIGESVREVLQETPGLITEIPSTQRLVSAYIKALVASPIGTEWATPSVVATLLKSPLRELRELGIQQVGQQRGSAELPRRRR